MSSLIFRGKDARSEEWVCGFMIHAYKDSSIGLIGTYINEREIKVKTLGQYVGLNDKNGQHIFEGDLLYINKKIPCAEVIWSEKYHGFALLWHGDDIYDVRSEPLYCFDRCPMQIIGNIYEKDIQDKIKNIKIWNEK